VRDQFRKVSEGGRGDWGQGSRPRLLVVHPYRLKPQRLGKWRDWQLIAA